MSEPGKAVFLSYASQDAEAAKRIADVLRTAGVEVWFDAEGGLEHGDEWDAKIRRQIKECVLFIPVISANTQAREEGYFRIEWELAAQRSLGIASGVAFILPVVVDDTKEGDALVPDRFLSVQWTRARGGELTPEQRTKFVKLWSHRAGVLKHAAVEAGRPRPAEERGGGTPPPSLAKPGWKAYAGLGAGIVALVAAVGWWTLRRGEAPVTPPPATPAAPSVAPAPAGSDVQQLIARARSLAEALDSSRDDFKLAEDLLEKARQKDDTDAEVSAGLAQLHGRYIQRGWDISDARRESARAASQRALRLDPRSYEARLAATFLLADNQAEGGEKVRQLQELRRERPTDQRLLRALATVLNRLGKLEEADAINDESAALPGGDPLALYNKSLNRWFAGRTVEAEQAIEASLAQRPFTGALLISAWYATYLHGDVARAREILARIPAAEMQQDRAAYFAYFIEHHDRRPEAAIARLEAVPREWINDAWYRGPKAALVGDALQLAGRTEAAAVEWRKALRLVDERLAAGTADDVFPTVRIALLARLGERAAAEKELAVRTQRFGFDLSGAAAVPRPFTYICILLGRKAEAIRQISLGLQRDRRAVDYTAALLRANPTFDPLRSEPEFAKVIAEAEAIERAAEAAAATATSGSKAGGSSSAKASPADAKSVAVLAFANLSDDKANEYFSDGISEELLNVLAKVPGLKVSARTSAFYFKGKEVPIPEIARQLGVAYVIEGSVRKSGEKVRITAQLIKASDGFRVWSDTFTRDLKDIFAVQDEIAGLIAQQLQLKLGATARAAAPIKPEAFELYVQARRAWNLRNAAGFAQAEELLTRALLLEPGFARAHVALADVWMLRAIANGVIDTFGQRTAPVFTQIVSGIEKALALDPDSSEAHASLGLTVRLRQWDLSAAEREFRRAVELNPNYATAHHWLGNCLFESGRIDEGLAELRRAAELDPFSLRILESHAQGLVYAGRAGEALGVLGHAEALLARSRLTLFLKAEALLQLGRRAEAIATLRELDPEDRAELLARAGEKAEAEAALAESEGWARYALLSSLGRTAEALAALRADDVPSTEVGNWLLDPRLDPFRKDPHFVELLKTLGLTEAHARMQAWRAAQPETGKQK